MTYALSSPLQDEAGTVVEALAALDRPDGEDVAYVNELHRLAQTTQLSFAVAFAQFCHETDFGRSPRWLQHRNPAGLGVDSDAAADPASFTGAEAAQVHMWALTIARFNSQTGTGGRSVAKAKGFYDRWIAKFSDPNCPQALTIADLGRHYVDAHGEPQAVWGWDPQYSSAIVERANQIFGGTQTVTKFTTAIPGLPGGPLETTYPVALKVIPVGLQRPGAPAHMPRRSVQHGNGNPNAMAAADAQWLANGAKNDEGKPTKTSWHAIGDDTQVIVQVPLNEVTWHAADGPGPGNMNGVSCEMSEHRAIWSDQSRALRCIANCADFMGRVAARFGIDKPEQHWDFNWVECCNTPCDVQCGNRHNCPDKLRHSTVAGRPAWDIYVGDWNAAKTDELARMHGTTPAPIQPSPIWWKEGEVGPKKRASDGVVALAMLGEVKALRTVPLHKDADAKSPKVGEVKEGQNATVVGTYHGKQRWAFVKIVDGQYGRALWSAFDPRWPTL